jgi:hypothetical protein
VKTLTLAPADAVARRERRPDDLAHHVHRQLIGYAGFALPILLVAVSGMRPIEGVERWQVLGSISAYYHTSATVVFVGVLAALALFLLIYPGYDNPHGWVDRWAARLAAIAALGVAAFPTEPPAGVPPPAWWRPWNGGVHLASAAVLFTLFAVFALWLFRLKDGDADPAKLRRNHLYLACGLAIVGSMAWAYLAHGAGRSIFWPETTALGAFAVSWLAKGRAVRSIVETARSVLGRPSAPSPGPSIGHNAPRG